MTMKDVFDFFHAALPLVAIGLCVAIFLAKAVRKRDKDEQSGDYGTEGMCLGMSLGTAIGASIYNNIGLGISLGMLIGLAIGTCIKKGSHGEGNDEK